MTSTMDLIKLARRGEFDSIREIVEREHSAEMNFALLKAIEIVEKDDRSLVDRLNSDARAVVVNFAEDIERHLLRASRGAPETNALRGRILRDVFDLQDRSIVCNEQISAFTIADLVLRYVTQENVDERNAYLAERDGRKVVPESILTQSGPVLGFVPVMPGAMNDGTRINTPKDWSHPDFSILTGEFDRRAEDAVDVPRGVQELVDSAIALGATPTRSEIDKRNEKLAAESILRSVEKDVEALDLGLERDTMKVVFVDVDGQTASFPVPSFSYDGDSDDREIDPKD